MDPQAYLTRSFCVLELYGTVDGGAKLFVQTHWLRAADVEAVRPSDSRRTTALIFAAHMGDVDAVGLSIEQLESMLVSLKAERSEAVDEAEEEALAADKKRDEVRAAMAKAMESFEREASTIRKQIDALEALADYARGEDPIAALKELKDAKLALEQTLLQEQTSFKEALAKERAAREASEVQASCGGEEDDMAG